MKNIEVPFNGNRMLRHNRQLNPITMTTYAGYKMEPGEPFEDIIKFQRYVPGGFGGSYPYIEVAGNITGKSYVMSIDKFMKIAPKMSNGSYRGLFGFTCRGGVAYSIYELVPGQGKYKDWRVPFDNDVGMCRSEPLAYSIFGHQRTKQHDRLKWLDPNITFNLNLMFDNLGSNVNSGHVAIFKSDTGHTYYMFMSDFEEIISKMREGRLQGEFKFKKAGRYFGVQFVKGWSKVVV